MKGISSLDMITGGYTTNETPEKIKERTGVDVKIPTTPIQQLADVIAEMDGTINETTQLLIDCIIELDERITTLEGGGQNDSAR